MATYYVATAGGGGSDANAGTIGSPWLTIKKGVENLAAGDTLYIRSGTYSAGNDRIWGEDLTAGGTDFGAGAITISAYPGETVTISHADQLIKFPGGTDWHYIVITGTNSVTPNLIIDLDYYNDMGVYIDPPNSHIRLTNVEIKNAGNHMCGVGADNVELRTSILHETDLMGNGAPIGNAWYGAGNNQLVEDCTIYNTDQGAIRFMDSAAGGVTGCIARRNRIYNFGLEGAGHGFGILLGGEGVNAAYNNVIFTGNGPGIWVDFDTPDGNELFNNTITNVSSQGILVSAGALNANVKNNIVYSNSVDIQDDGTGTVLSNNLTTNPSFVGGGDYHIQTGSVAKDAGATLAAVPDDYDGLVRPQGPFYDIGAYEYPETNTYGLTGIAVTMSAGAVSALSGGAGIQFLGSHSE